MTFDDSTRVFYAMEFVRDFKKANNKHPKFHEDFDNFLTELKKNRVRDIRRMRDMPPGCNGFQVSKVRTFHCSELNKGSTKGYRIIYAEYRSCILFVECYFKSKDENENKPRICKSLTTVRNQDCIGHFVEQKVPNSRFLLKRPEDWF